MAGYGLAGVAAAVTLAFAGLVAYVAMYDAPFWDLWQHVDRDNLLKDLFSRNNEHPVVTNRLLFWIDDALFGASSRFVQLVALLALAAQVVLLVGLARLADVARPVLAVAPAAIVFVFFPFGFENTIWIFQVSMVLAFTSAVGAFVLFAGHVETNAWPALAGSLAFSVIAVLSFANGVFVPTFLVVMALWLSPRAAVPFAIIAVFAWIWQLTATPASATDGLSIGALGPMFSHVLTQLGAPIGWAAGYLPRFGAPPLNNLHAAMQAGVVVMLLSGLALAFIGLRARKSPAGVAAAAIILFTLVTSMLIAFSRHAMGVEQALSSRYNVNVALLYSTLLIVALMALGQAPESIRRWSTWGGAALALLLTVMSLTAAPIFQDLNGRYRASLPGTTALVAGVRDLSGVAQLSFDYDMAAHETDKFRADGKWMFAALTPRRVGGRLTAEETALPACGGSSWSVSPPNDKEGYRAGDGTLARQERSAGAIHVLITDASGAITGYGIVPRRASDLNPLAQRDGARIDWLGRIRANASPPFRAWLADDRNVRCSLGVAQRPPS
jgi:hypothetical protein